MKSLFSVSLLLLANTSFARGSEEKVVVCYYGTWAAYRSGLGKFQVTDIPTDLCTHLVYTFVGIDYSGNVISLDPYLDYAENWGKDCLRKFNALKKINPNLKTILAVGGYNEGSQKYSLMASNPQLRRNFITTSLSMLTKYGFDGLEVDWEYPNRGDSIYGQEDVNNFSQLLKEVREEFDKRGLLLTASVAAVEEYAKLSYNVSAISNYLDLVSIMAYDMYGPWDPVTGHNAPLHKGEGDENVAPEKVFSIDFALQYWLKQGEGPMLILGTSWHDRGRKLCHKFLTEPWDVRQDNLAKVPYAVQNRNWVSYDDPNSLVAKVEYGLQYGIAGVMMWSIETDDFHGICRNGTFPLLRSVNAALGRTA